ncbi:hypothetical protein [Mammaliicoccus sciuri]|uniref:hypothetical protein n=1 Tax=Mammaliicoccus sciuri TaxID=1296 RepID=UPI0018B091DF|nr:hypothetical protein [Mammaliicoccus sciuri]MBF9297664.1 hypothetical protein [Staphylococcus schleiferi]MDO0949535.1 hypothetical protein [Mammaliicoccus sciuri]MDO0954980.1 hypothetical protein [Mammaliicoccus sciuri]
MDEKKLSLSTSKLGKFTVKVNETNRVTQNEIMIIEDQSRYEYVNGSKADLVSKVIIQEINISSVDIEITEIPTFSLGINFEKIVLEHLLTLLFGFLFKLTYEFDEISILKEIHLLTMPFMLKFIVIVFTVIILYKLLAKLLWY